MHVEMLLYIVLVPFFATFNCGLLEVFWRARNEIEPQICLNIRNKTSEHHITTDNLALIVLNTPALNGLTACRTCLSGAAEQARNETGGPIPYR